MYTIAEGMANVWSDQTMIVIAAFITYGFGFLQYGCSMWMQVRNKQCPFYFWMHCWYFGHDFTFAFICFNQWFFQIDWWLWKVLCIGCMAFVGIEIFSLYQTVKNERDEVFGIFTYGKPVSKKTAWALGLLGFAIGVLLFQALRVTVGDPLCLFLMMSTNAILALMVQRRFTQVGRYQPGMKFLAVATLLGTIFTFCPRGIGFFASVVDPLNNPFFFAVGALCVATSIRAIYLAWKFANPNWVPAQRLECAPGAAGALAADESDAPRA